jgi:hypothetical protein
MATMTAGRKRRQKAAPASAGAGGEDVRDGQSSEFKKETPPPSKKRRDDRPTEEPVEETDRVVIEPPLAKAATKETRRKPKKSAKLAADNLETAAMETGTTITHHSHSSVHGEVFVLGQGDMGQLGLGEELMERKKPHPVGGALEGLRDPGGVWRNAHSGSD